MCGRYALALNAEVIAEAFRCAAAGISSFKPSFNIAPTHFAPVIRQRNSERTATLLKWGLIPSWAKDPSIGSRMINARSETVAEKPSFRSAYKTRRCIVPASAFFEWRSMSDGKQPYAFSAVDSSVLAFAGLWERWGEGDTLVESFTIITTAANALLGQLHDRMPVILDTTGVTLWLDGDASPEALAALLVPMADGELDATAVSRKVNSPANNSPDLLEPIAADLFGLS